MSKDYTQHLSHGDILVVDDETFNLKFLTEVLSQAGYRVRPATDGELALRSVLAKPPELVLLDIKMPGMSGIEVCRRLKADPVTQDIPVIFLSALQETDMKVKALKEGAVDYVTKPIESAEVLARIASHLNSYRLQQRLASQSEELLKEIEERKRAEQSLKEAEQRFRLLYEQAPLPYQSLDNDGHIIEVNGEWLKTLGYSRQEVIGRPLTDFLPARGKDIFAEEFPRFKAEGEVLGVEIAMLKKDGRTIIVSLNGKIAQDDLHHAIQTHCIFKDITTQRRMEEKLRRSEESYRELIESTGDLVTRVDGEGKFVFVNHMAVKIFGLAPEALVGMPAFPFVHPDDQQATEAWFEECVSAKASQATFENRQVHQGTGEAHCLLWTSNFHYDNNGEVDGVYGIGHDITERKEAEEKLKDMSEQLSLLLESLPVVVYTRQCQGDLGLTFVSSRIDEITGFAPDKFITEPTFWADHLHPEDKYKVVQELATVLQQGRSYDSYRFQSADGSYKWFSCTCRLVKFPDGSNSHIVGTWQDITEEKRLQLESDQQLEQIIQADKLSSLGEVVAGVAHEINNPNSFITYNVPLLAEIWQVLEPLIDRQTSPLLQSGLSVAECCQDMEEIISAIQTGSERINKVVNNLKDFARLDEDSHSEPVQINEVVDKAYSIVGAQVRKSTAHITLNLEQDMPLIQGHFQKLEQVVANLLINAAHAINDKQQGKISVSSHYSERLQSIVVSIEDNGMGIDPETTARIFEPFFTTKRNSGGTGLGLSVSYGLIQEHNGLIALYSRPGLGSRFSLLLPITEESKPLRLQPAILCLCDKEPCQCASFFADADQQMFSIPPEPAKLPAFLADHPEVDLVFIDLRPSQNRAKIMGQLKKDFPLLTIIASSFPVEKEEDKAASLADFLLPYPVQLPQVLDLVNSISRVRL
ncbi:MAG: PAS domain S-box protein [Thermodesulfobacteriota bacterium]